MATFPSQSQVSGTPRHFGSWLPFFYNDKKRTFFVLPSLRHPCRPETGQPSRPLAYYPEIKQTFRHGKTHFEGQVAAWLEASICPRWPPAQRQALEQSLYQSVSRKHRRHPYTDEQIEGAMKRSSMRFFHYYLGIWSLGFFQCRQFHFKNFYHPFVCDFAKLVY